MTLTKHGLRIKRDYPNGLDAPHAYVPVVETEPFDIEEEDIPECEIGAALDSIIEFHERSARYHRALKNAIEKWGIEAIGDAVFAHYDYDHFLRCRKAYEMNYKQEEYPKPPTEMQEMILFYLGIEWRAQQ
jgi:hypothetical protein